MLTAIVLTVIAVAFRLASPALEIWNFVPLGALSLYAGARLPRRWAWAVPIAAMALSDLVLDFYGIPTPLLTRVTVYATFAATTLLGPIANLPKIGPSLLPILSASGSIVFFLTSNLATWAEGLNYPVTFAGLVTCYGMAIPFFGNTVAADLLGTAVLFGLGPVFEQAALLITRPRLAEITTDVKHSDAIEPARTF
jgi:hypothetical protein